MADQEIFCNAPWYELNIYWDGSLGACCQELKKPYRVEETQYNVKSMSLADWFNSAPVIDFRKKILGSKKIAACEMCYNEEKSSSTSKRVRGNQKSVIFTRSAFSKSFEQSPGKKHFNESGLTLTEPVDLHIDLGNYCNLACKMCTASASSTIATQLVKWGDLDSKKFIGTDWTRSTPTWNRVLAEIAAIKKLSNVHFMGGETLISAKFEEFVDFMIAQGRTDMGISFVSNGTTFNESLMKKLLRFQRVGIEVSIETLTAHNAYIRQGTDTEIVLTNLERYRRYCNDTSITLTIRPTISALSIGYYCTLLEYCLEHNLIVKSLVVTQPNFLQVNVLPTAVRNQYIKQYTHLTNDLEPNVDYNESSVSQIKRIIQDQARRCVNLLLDPVDNSSLFKQTAEHCQKWDRIYNYNVLDLYPELADTFIKHGY